MRPSGPAGTGRLYGLSSDGGGRADLLVNFPGFGLWQWRNNTAWAQVHPFNATVMTAGDIDGSGQDDAIISFPGFGVWA